MRKLFLLLIVPAFFACKEKDLTTENPAKNKDNVNIETSILYDTSTVHLDTIYTNNLGLEFYFTEMSFAFSDYTFAEKGDTILHRPEPFLITAKNQERLISRFVTGGYSGQYGLRLGLDSAQGVGYTKAMAQDDELKNSSVFRLDADGIDHIVIKGKLFDPLDPLDSIGKIPFDIRIGTTAYSRSKISDVNNFSVSGTAVIPFIVQINLWPVFNDMQLYDRPVIKTDPTNQFDMDAALEVADSLQVNLF
ncbi:hypothetical protein [Owenweeksia hongkongensis]|uniref:hypothetical protein n=1 Tax=Owenweeksia hongkongensis TaxID=253245 RepID=UPI003A912FCB